jgi:hypothetical protein
MLLSTLASRRILWLNSAWRKEAAMSDAGPFSPGSLEAFCRDQIRADLYPSDHHPFTLFACERCGLGPYRVDVTEHEGSERGDFHGVVAGTCRSCGATETLFSCTREAPIVTGHSQVRCECGGEWFWVGLLERYEGEEGLPGFFDEGVVAGQCALCGQNRAVVFTD